MSKRGRWRLMVAGIAALGVHVLLMAGLGAPTVAPRIDNGTLAVLLIRPSEASSRAEAPATKNKPKKVQSEMPHGASAKHAAGRHRLVHAHAGRERVRLATHHSASPKRLALNHVSTRPKSAASAQAGDRVRRTQTGTKVRPAPLVQGAGLPSSARRSLLAHIVYPRLARRLGWEGKGLFRLDVQQRRIVRVAPLASTGHRVLDRAVLEGLRDVARLDVADGWYRLPVEFRLQ